MAPALGCCSCSLLLALLTLLISITTFSVARPQPPAVSSFDVPLLPVSPAVVHSSPARPIPSDSQFGAPVPLPEFPTLPPPIVNSFPASPLPSIASPPQDVPLLPGTTQPPPPSCHGYQQPPIAPPLSFGPPYPSSGPVIAPEPIAPSEGAPEPIAGGASPPPY